MYMKKSDTSTIFCRRVGPWAVPEGVKCPRERRADGVVTTLGPADLGHSYTGYKPGDKQKPQSQPAPSQVL